jgi:hypothetical protein
VILIGSDGAHHSLSAVSLYAEAVFLDAVFDPVDQLSFLFFGSHLIFPFLWFGFLFHHLHDHYLIQLINNTQQ